MLCVCVYFASYFCCLFLCREKIRNVTISSVADVSDKLHIHTYTHVYAYARTCTVAKLCSVSLFVSVMEMFIVVFVFVYQMLLYIDCCVLYLDREVNCVYTHVHAHISAPIQCFSSFIRINAFDVVVVVVVNICVIHVCMPKIPTLFREKIK